MDWFGAEIAGPERKYLEVFWDCAWCRQVGWQGSAEVCGVCNTATLISSSGTRRLHASFSSCMAQLFGSDHQTLMFGALAVVAADIVAADCNRYLQYTDNYISGLEGGQRPASVRYTVRIASRSNAPQNKIVQNQNQSGKAGTELRSGKGSVRLFSARPPSALLECRTLAVWRLRVLSWLLSEKLAHGIRSAWRGCRRS